MLHFFVGCRTFKLKMTVNFIWNINWNRFSSLSTLLGDVFVVVVKKKVKKKKSKMGKCKNGKFCSYLVQSMYIQHINNINTLKL
jgi:hypothetical protein